MITARMQLQAGIISDQEWNVLIVGVVINESVLAANPMPHEFKYSELMSEKQWANMVMLESEMPSVFGGLCKNMRDDPKSWQHLIVTETPHTDPLPGDWEGKLSPFRRLLLIRVLREDKVSFAIKTYVYRVLGEYFTESPPFDLEGAYSDSTQVSPLIFILSPGADPTDYLLQLSQSKGKGGSGLRIISLGQGQGPIAERALQQAQLTGDWVCLQNCHLAVSWLPKLEFIVEKMQNEPDNVNSGFRLWLTSMPSAVFPVTVLQNGIKVTNEPPRGLRANLLRTFMDMSSEEYESCSKPSVFKRLIFAVAFFNALALERRKFGAVGWNIPYEWMNSDLKAAMTQVRMYVEEQVFVPWETLNVQVSDITYGGRVTDSWDKRAISSILRRYFAPELMHEGFMLTEGTEYYVPPPEGIQELRQYIRQLPAEDAPYVFGLHANAAITFQSKESRNLIQAVVTCSGGGGAGGASDSTQDHRVQEIAAKIMERLPDPYDLRKAHPETFKKFGDAVNSLGVFLGQELVRFNGLIDVMRSSLSELQRAIRGEVVMSSELELMYNCFVFQKVPPSWENAGYPCLKPLHSWTEDFLRRIEFMGSWLLHGPRLTYWLPGFFFPQGFMTALKQTYSREHKIAVDTLRIGCEMTALESAAVAAPPSSGAYVYGLFMEGGRFDREKMVMADSKPRELFDSMPCIWLKPVVVADYQPKDVYDCPLYKTSLRAGTLSTTGHSTNFVVALPIPTQKDQNHWIRRGCAMLCMLDD
jgi:dynein heavy chain